LNPAASLKSNHSCGLVLLAAPVPLILCNAGVACLAAHARCGAVCTHAQVELALCALAATLLALGYEFLAGGGGGGLGGYGSVGPQALRAQQTAGRRTWLPCIASKLTGAVTVYHTLSVPHQK
jgi:hypothetical protein